MILYVQSGYYERGSNPIAKLSEIIDSYSKRYTITTPTHQIDTDIQSKIEPGILVKVNVQKLDIATTYKAGAASLQRFRQERSSERTTFNSYRILT